MAQVRNKPLTLEEAARDDALVHHMLRSGASATEIALALVEHSRELREKIFQLEAIAPKKIVNGDQVLIWRCPDELVPEVGQ